MEEGNGNGNSVAFGTTPEGCSISRDMRSKSEICLALLLLYYFPFFHVFRCCRLPLLRFYEDYALMITQ